MKVSIVLEMAASFLIGFILLFSLYLLFNGHNSVGGGFSGGLTAVGACALYVMSYGAKELQMALKVKPMTILIWGGGLVLTSGLLPHFTQQSFLTGLWKKWSWGSGRVFHIGTPLIFDLGVYLIVFGGAFMALGLIEEEE